MATYNGEAYLPAQLDSILNQTNGDWVLYIRDDGSTDSTVSILCQYSLLNPGRIKILEDSIKHRGARDSFMFLLSEIEADYYLFSDQDDIWLPSKVQMSIDKVKDLEQRYPNLPIMIHTDLEIVDGNLNRIWPSFWNWRKFNVDLNKHFCFAPFGNVFTGCTMAFNKELKRYCFPMPDFAKMHDEWIGLVATKYGKVDNIKVPTIKYRQHGENVCSIGKKRTFKFRDIFKKPIWYAQILPMLEYLSYGGMVKAFSCKFFYSSYRRFFHD